MAALELSRTAHLQIAFFLRQLGGWWFFMLGRWKLFELDGGARAVAERFFVEPYQDTFLPVWALRAAGWFDPLAEFACGLMLIFGVGVRPATWVLMGLLVMVTFGHQLKEPTYALSDHVLPAALLLIGIAALAGPKDALTLGALARPIWRRLRK
ncbi:MAG: DoxX family membrane protein [Planctomycetota bacterium]|nr:MAG: DoxX family membrane protein [Planctomycetota bacterium]